MSEMGWTDTHRRWQALQEIEVLANEGALDALPWNAEYAELFGDRRGLVAALRSRWDNTRHAQLDSHLPESLLDEQRCRLEERNAGVVRLLAAYDASLIDRTEGRIPA